MSAPFRYARILNGLSFLISSRSAISRRMRAIWPLSNAQAFHVDVVVEHLRPAGSKRVGDRGSLLRRAVAEDAAAAAGAADLRGRGAGRRGARAERVDRRRRDAGRETLAVLPFRGDVTADCVPVLALERLPQRDRRIANPLEAVEDRAVAVDVALHDVPVVRARITRRAGVGE